MEKIEITKEALIKLLKDNLTIEVDIHKTYSNIHDIKTIVKFGDEVISETIKKECPIGIWHQW
jgi:hypothetical protein